MPYVKQEQRPQLDALVAKIDSVFKRYKNDNWIRILYSFCKQLTPSYNTYKNYFGELTEAAAEIRRRESLTGDREIEFPLDVEVSDEERKDIAGLVIDMLVLLKADGDLNYVLFAWQKRHLAVTPQKEYFVTEIETLVPHLRSEFLSPYEDKKIKLNGDVMN